VRRRDFIKDSTAAVVGTTMFPLLGVTRDNNQTTFAQSDRPGHAKYIWYDKNGKGRNLYAPKMSFALLKQKIYSFSLTLLPVRNNCRRLC
jgi:hypothetical protein